MVPAVGISTPAWGVWVDGECVDVAVEDDSRAAVVAVFRSGAVEFGDNVWLGTVWGDEVVWDVLGMKVVCYDFCCGGGVAWGVGRRSLDKRLQELDLGGGVVES